MYLLLVFLALAAVGNAHAKGGRSSLEGPAAVTGFATAGVNNVLILVVGRPALAANTISAFVPGILAGTYAVRAGYPQQVLALMVITGALRPGIPMFFGILQEMRQSSGLPYFGQAALIMLSVGVGVGVGVGIGVILVLDRATGRAPDRAQGGVGSSAGAVMASAG